MLADTAQLAVVLKLEDQLSGGVTAAEAKMRGLANTAGSTATAGLSRLQTAAGGVGGALNHAANQLKGLAMGVGIGLGVVGAGGIIGFFTSAIDQAKSFGETVDRLNSMTGLSVEKVSALASAFNYFGVSGDTTIRVVGMMEKNLGNLTATSKAAAAFQKTYGLSLKDANGHVKDANQLILDSADYFNNKAIPAQTKAAALAKLYGRNWQDLVEVFEQGSGKIKAAEEQAAALGLTLSSKNMDDMLKLRDATRDWNTALGGLKLQLGLLVIGPLTDLTNSATHFISDPNNRQSILGFFKGLIQAAKDAGAFIGNTVIPTIQGLATAARTFWGAIPPPLRDLLAKAFVGDRIIKFAFGFSPITFAADALKGPLSSLLGSFFQRGGTPANPLFVADVTGGGGAGGAVGGGAGLASSLLKGGLLTAVAAAAVIGFKSQVLDPGLDKQSGGVRAQAQNMAATNKSLPQLESALAAVQTGIRKIAGNDTNNPLVRLLYGKQIDDLIASQDALKAAINQQKMVQHSGSSAEAKIEADAAAALKAQRTGTQALMEAVRGTGTTQAISKWGMAQVAKADAIVNSNKTTAQKIAALQSLETRIGSQNRAATDAVAAKIARLRLDPHITVTTNVGVSITDIAGKGHTTVMHGNVVHYGNRPVGVGMGAT